MPKNLSFIDFFMQDRGERRQKSRTELKEWPGTNATIRPICGGDVLFLRNEPDRRFAARSAVRKFLTVQFCVTRAKSHTFRMPA